MRNWLYDRQMLRSFQFDFPVIGVGNLSTGGSGKTPMVDYLVRMLGDYRMATLSRGYGRRSRGYLLAGAQPAAEDLGDEPAWLKFRHPNLEVAVCESRVQGVAALLQDAPELDLVILDDVFQHRAIKPGLNLLLTTWQEPFTKDKPLPAGRLREFRSGARRADAVIVTKSPVGLGSEKAALVAEIQRYTGAEVPVYFAGLRYTEPRLIQGEASLLEKPYLVTGIANPQVLADYVKGQWPEMRKHRAFRDHHKFSVGQLKMLIEEARKLHADGILLTEKDAMRWPPQQDFPVWTQPVEMYLADGEAEFLRMIHDYIRKAELSRPEHHLEDQ
jgi:tetraacyldisaccharide 4'-kinase